MFGFHKPKMYRSIDGCCICRAKSSSSRFTDSKRYEKDFHSCFGLHENRSGEICNACVLLVKRWKKLPVGSKKNWNHINTASSSNSQKPRSKSNFEIDKGPKLILKSVKKTKTKKCADLDRFSLDTSERHLRRYRCSPVKIPDSSVNTPDTGTTDGNIHDSGTETKEDGEDSKEAELKPFNKINSEDEKHLPPAKVTTDSRPSSCFDGDGLELKGEAIFSRSPADAASSLQPTMPILCPEMNNQIPFEERTDLEMRFRDLVNNNEGCIPFYKLRDTLPCQLREGQVQFVKEVISLDVSSLQESPYAYMNAVNESIPVPSTTDSFPACVDRQQHGCISLLSLQEILRAVLDLDFSSYHESVWRKIIRDLQLLLKAQKKAVRREQVLKIETEKRRLRTILQVQYILQNLQEEHVRKDFRSGLNGAPFLSARELDYLLKFSKLASLVRDEMMSLEDQMEQATSYLWELLEGGEKVVVGTTYKHLKAQMAKLMDCGYFDHIPVPQSKMLEEVKEVHKLVEVAKTEPLIKLPNEGAKELVKVPEPSVQFVQTREVQSREFLNRRYLPEPDFHSQGKTKTLQPWKADFAAMKQEPPDSWEMQFEDSRMPSPQPVPTKQGIAAAGLVAKDQVESKVTITSPKKVPKPIHSPIAVFNSTSSLPKDPALRKQKLQDLMAQIQGSFSFMQTAPSTDDSPSTSLNGDRSLSGSEIDLDSAAAQVFKVNAPLPPRDEPDMKPESYNQSYSTASTQTTPQCSSQPAYTLDQNPLPHETLQPGKTNSFLICGSEAGYQQNYKRGGGPAGQKANSRGWSDSSQVSSPERDHETFNSVDSGQGDSRCITPIDIPVTSQATTLMPVHVYPLPPQMRVAFSAARTSNFTPGTLDQTIAFDLLLNNLGETFEMHMGRFSCPVNGTYVFIFHMLKLAVNVPLYVNLMKNEEVLVSAYANDGAPDHETASNHAVLQLYQGDQIWLRLHRGAIYGSSWKYSTFSGYLLYQD
ncbi:Caprin-2 [Acipenser ruthenus]|uniref:Caprin-2 n=1 Tax=Acipenser ruthenus TaxID=7906 RepID=A0A444U4M4_ACIRT|nr:Caprin-2 [Acipenser ruthenus]